MLAGEKVHALEKSGRKFKLETESGKKLTADAVVAGIGIEPEVGLAKVLGLELDNGIVVDAELRTTRPDIYAAGDVANCYSPALGVRRRVEHQDNANVMGATRRARWREATERNPSTCRTGWLGASRPQAGGQWSKFGASLDIHRGLAGALPECVVYYLLAGLACSARALEHGEETAGRTRPAR